MSKLRGLLLGILWSLELPQVRCSVRLVLLPVVVIIPPLISLIISASSIVVVPPILVRIVLSSMVIVSTLIVPLVGAVIEVMSGCHHVVFLLELRAFISIMAIINTNSTNSLWD